MIRAFLIVLLVAGSALAASTNKPPAAAKEKKLEKKAEHSAGKIIVKAREQGSKKGSDYKVESEYKLMFNNNRKAKKEKNK